MDKEQIMKKQTYSLILLFGFSLPKNFGIESGGFSKNCTAVRNNST